MPVAPGLDRPPPQPPIVQQRLHGKILGEISTECWLEHGFVDSRQERSALEGRPAEFKVRTWDKRGAAAMELRCMVRWHKRAEGG